MKISTRSHLATLVAILLLLAACREAPSTDAPVATESPGAAPEVAAPEAAVGAGPTATALVLASPTPIPPTPTPAEPLAALVNGQPIFLATFERELGRYEQGQAELGLTPGADGLDYRALVLQNLVDQALIAQAAAAANVAITADMVQGRAAELQAEAGDAAAFQAWLEANQFSEVEFREALAREMLTEQMKERVTAEVPFAVPQVHARYLQVDDPALAASLRDQIVAGGDFAALAAQYSLDRQTAAGGGDLDWFPRGTLLVPAVEEAAFSLTPGDVSEVIAVPAPGGGPGGGPETYYILQVLEREEARALSPQQRAVLLQEAFESWLADLRAAADISLLVEPGG